MFQGYSPPDRSCGFGNATQNCSCLGWLLELVSAAATAMSTLEVTGLGEKSAKWVFLLVYRKMFHDVFVKTVIINC